MITVGDLSLHTVLQTALGMRAAKLLLALLAASDVAAAKSPCLSRCAVMMRVEHPVP